MTVKVVTDSGADIPKEIMEELGIKTVPYLVQFGGETRRDRVDITPEEIYQRLEESLKEGPQLTTSAPFPKDFIDIYQECGADGIISIHLTGKHSATYDSALNAKAIVEEEKKCQYHIEVIDSRLIVMGMGFLAILAAELAKEGKSLKEIVKAVEDAIPKIHLLCVLDSLKYVEKGGRLGKVALRAAQAATSMLNLKALLTLKKGEISFAGVVRPNRKKERLMEFISSFTRVKEAAVEYTAAKDKGEAEDLLETINHLFPGVPLYLSQISSVIGVHSGPGALVVALREE